ncbi:organic cation/carnitine transporter 3, partial [Prunus dulcis]
PPPSYCSQRGFWAAAAASGHHLGWHRSQKNRAILLFPSRPIPATGTTCARRKMQKSDRLTQNSRSSISLLRPPIQMSKIVRS